MKEVDEIDVVEEKMGPEVQKRFDKYLLSPHYNNCFFGSKHTLEELYQNSGSISVQRQGGISVTVLSMLIEEKDGKPLYTIDQLYDPNQFQKEKQDRFDEIVNRSRKTNKDRDKTMAESEGGKWFVETIYKGIHRLTEIIDEEAEKIDFTKDDFMYSEQFAKVSGYTALLFDAWQEIHHFENIMDEVIQADKPELTTKDARTEYIDGMVNPLSKNFLNMHKMFDYHNKAGKQDINLISYMSCALHFKYVEKVMRDWKKSGKKLSQYMADNQISRKMDKNLAVIDDELDEYKFKFLDIVPPYEVVDRRIQDGSLFENVEYDDKTESFNFFPKLNEDNTDFIVEDQNEMLFEAGDDYLQKVGKYSFAANEELKQSFLGNKYTTEEIRNVTGIPVTVHRTAGYSITAINLLAKKKDGKPLYSVADVFNPKKFRKQKFAEFETVLNHAKNAESEPKGKNNEHTKWLVDNIYSSIMNAVEVIDELAEKIDFDDERFYETEEYYQICLLANVIHDAWQEITGFPDLMDEKLQAKFPDLKTREDRYKAFEFYFGPLCAIGGNMVTMRNEHEKNVNDTGKYFNLSQYLNIAIKQSSAHNMFREWHEKGNGKSLTQYFRDNNLAEIYSNMDIPAQEALDSLIMNCSNNRDSEKQLDKLYMDGILFKDVEYVPGKNGANGVFKNVPTYDLENHQVIFPKVKKKAVKKTAKKTVKRDEPVIETLHGEKIPVEEVIDYLQALKQTAGETRGFFYDSQEYTDFYMAIDDVMEAARALKKNKNDNIINEERDVLKDYKVAVNRLKDCAEAYEVYKMTDHTKDQSKEPDKKALNGDDKRKLKLMDRVLRNNRYFNVETPKLTNAEFLRKADRAIFRLKQGEYKYKKNYIEDSAYAMYGQMYRVSGSKDKIDLQQIMKDKVASGDFEKSLISKKDPTKYIASQEVAKKAQNRNKMKDMVETVKKEVADKNNNKKISPKKGTAKGKEQGKGKGPL